MAVTIRDVAKRAGVSITTVSHVINDTRFVSDKLKERVETAIAELNYHPNPLGRGLRKGETRTIAVLLPDPGNPFFQTVNRGIEEETYESNFSITCCNTDEDPERERFFLTLMLQRGVDGFIVAPTVEAEDNLRIVEKEGIPLVIVDRATPAFSLDQVYSKSKEGGYAATAHLLSLGHDRIATLVGIRGLSTIESRLQGYCEALKERGIDPDEQLMADARSKMEDAFSATRQLLETHKDVTAIFTTNNLMTLGALKYFKEQGIECPKDISIIGFDDSEWASISTPALTVVSQQAYEMGYRAGERLMSRVLHPENSKKAQTIELETELIVRESTAPPTKNKRSRR